jgi:hypothetical protein
MPNGLKTYAVLVDSIGKVHQIPSCSVVLVDKAREERLRDLIDNSSLVMDQILPRLGALDLAPIVRRGLQEQGEAATSDPSTYLVLVDPAGKVHRIEADQPGTIVLVDLNTERELRDQLAHRLGLGRTVARALGGFLCRDLAAIVRKGLEK